MFKTVKLIIVFGLCFMNLYSVAAQKEEFELPTIVLPTPTAFQMTQYGDVPVNESTGKINPNIPLYQYTAGKLELPIYLSYQGNGVKVDQMAGWTGINWNFNAGGVVTRVVRDKDDFHPTYTRISYPYTVINDMITNAPGNLNTHITSSGIDSEADIFQFSIPNYSGGFYLDENMEPHLTKYDKELRIELVPGQPYQGKEILIKTPEGVVYYFGGTNASSLSRPIYPTAGGGATDLCQTTFYLYKMENMDGDQIFFEYDTHGSLLKTAIVQRYSRVVSSSGGCGNEGQLGGLSTDHMNNFIQNERVLKRIYSNRNDIEIILNSVSPPPAPLSSHYGHRLSGFNVQDTSNDETIKNVSFTYIFPHKGNKNDIANAQRFFLSQVSLDDGSYRMEYNAPEDLPERLDYDQDHLGYFNNKGNEWMLPQTTNPFFPDGDTYADKSPDFEYSSKGVLTRLYYPTGGYTEFEYESGLSDKILTEIKSESFACYINYNNRPPEGIVNRNPRARPVPINNEDGSGGLINQRTSITLTGIKSTEILDSRSSICLSVVEGLIIDPECQMTMSFNSNNYTQGTDPYLGTVYRYPDYTFNNIRLEAGKQYTVVARIIPANHNSGATIYTHVNIKYEIDTGEFQEALGIRVKRVTDHSNNHDPVIKRYYYGNSNAIAEPQYLYTSKLKLCCSESDLVNLTSSSINTVYTTGSEKYYNNVSISYGGDEYENGGVEKYFRNFMDPTPYQHLFYSDIFKFPATRENKSDVSGTLIKEVVLEKRSGINDPVPVRETEYDYTFDFSNYFSNNAREKLYEICVNPNTSLDNLYVGTYHTYSTKVSLNASTVKEYDYNSPNSVSSPGIIENVTEYQYGDYPGLPEVILSASGVNNRTYRTEHTYPNPDIVVVPIGADSYGNILPLVEYNKIMDPVRTERYIVDGNNSPELLSTTKKYYEAVYPHNSSSASSHLKELHFLKGIETIDNIMEERVIYHDYDHYGNPLEVSKSNGPHIVYIWGYKGQYPVARIENMTYSDIPSVLITNIHNASNDTQMHTALNNLRNSSALEETLVTTYTYNPLIGISTITDPRGEKTTYTYDTFNRLEFIKDETNKLLEEYKYHYKN